MERYWLKMADENYPWGIIDVFRGARMERYGNQFGFSLYIIRRAASSHQTDCWRPGLDGMLTDIKAKICKTKTRVGSHGDGHHEAVQAVRGRCCCWYSYSGNKGHPHFHLPDLEYCATLGTVKKWLHGFSAIEEAGHAAEMNQTVVNCYTYSKD